MPTSTCCSPMSTTSCGCGPGKAESTRTITSPSVTAAPAQERPWTESRSSICNGSMRRTSSGCESESSPPAAGGSTSASCSFRDGVSTATATAIPGPCTRTTRPTTSTASTATPTAMAKERKSTRLKCPPSRRSRRPTSGRSLTR